MKKDKISSFREFFMNLINFFAKTGVMCLTNGGG